MISQYLKTITILLELIFVNGRVQCNNFIITEIFHRQHSYLLTHPQNWELKCIYENNGSVFYENRELCDIPKHCRLGIRVQMLKDSVWNIK
ncbi:phage tail fiber protein [Photorhabdus luminescens]